jgi:hypothetical protein
MVHSEALAVLQRIAGKPVFAKALPLLKPGTEIALRFEDRIDFALFYKDGSSQVAERKARADLEFLISAEAVRILEQSAGDQMAQFGIEVMEQILAGRMKVRVTGSFWRVATGGYLQIILAAGPDLLSYLTTHGLSSSYKIIEYIKSLK